MRIKNFILLLVTLIPIQILPDQPISEEMKINENQGVIEFNLADESNISEDLEIIMNNPDIRFAYIAEDIAQSIIKLPEILKSQSSLSDYNKEFYELYLSVKENKKMLMYDQTVKAIENASSLIEKYNLKLNEDNEIKYIIDSIEQYKQDLESQDALIMVEPTDIKRRRNRCKTFCKLLVRDFIKTRNLSVCGLLCAKNIKVCNLCVEGEFCAKIKAENCPSNQGIGVFQGQTDCTLFFKRIAAGNNITVTEDPENCVITISAVGVDENIESCDGEGIPVLQGQVGDTFTFRRILGSGCVTAELAPNNCDIVISLFESCPGEGANLLQQETCQLRQLVAGSCITLDENPCDITINSALTSCTGSGVEVYDTENCSIRRISGSGCITAGLDPNNCDVVVSSTLDNCTGSGVTLLNEAPDCTVKRLLAGSGVTITDSPCDVTISAVSMTGTVVNCDGDGIPVFQGLDGTDFVFRRILGSGCITATLDGNDCDIVIDSTIANCPGYGANLFNPDTCQIRQLIGGSCIAVDENDCDVTINSTLANCPGEIGATLLNPDTCQIRRIVGGSCITVDENTCDVTINSSLDNCTGSGIALFDPATCTIRRILGSGCVTANLDANTCDVVVSSNLNITGTGCINVDQTDCDVVISSTIGNCTGSGIELFDPTTCNIRRILGSGCVTATIDDVNNCDVVINSTLTNCPGYGADLFNPDTCQIRQILAGTCITVDQNDCDVTINSNFASCTGSGIEVFDAPNCLFRRIFAGTGVNVGLATNSCDITISTAAAGDGFDEQCYNASTMQKNNDDTPDMQFTDMFGVTPDNVGFNAWEIPPSTSTPEPVTIHCAVPNNINTAGTIEVELHFVTTREGTAGDTGNVRFRIVAKYLSFGENLNPAAPALDQTVSGADVAVTEPAGAPNEQINHYFTTITLSAATLGDSDMFIFAIDRVAPTVAPEFPGNVFLQSAIVRFPVT